MEGITQDISANDTAEVDFGSSPVKDVLKPMGNMIFQCAFGFYPDNKCYLIHPLDYEYDKTTEGKTLQRRTELALSGCSTALPTSHRWKLQSSGC